MVNFEEVAKVASDQGLASKSKDLFNLIELFLKHDCATFKAQLDANQKVLALHKISPQQAL